MSLSTKILVVTASTILGLGLVLFGIFMSIQLGSFAALEEYDTRQHVQRILNSFEANLAGLDSTARDYANWDDTAVFVETGDPQYIEKNLSTATLETLNVDLMLFTDKDNRIVHALEYDNAGDGSVSASWPALLAANRKLVEYPDVHQGITGIVVLPEGPMLVAGRPVLNSTGEGPTHGTLIMARYLDEDFIQELAAMLEMPFSVYTISDPQLPDELQAVLSSLSPAERVVVQPLSRASVAGYALLSDLFSQPNLILRMERPRNIYQQGERSLRSFMAAMLLIGVVLGVVLLFAMHRLVVQPIDQLKIGVEHVACGRLEYRIPTKEQDEIGQLAAAFNDMGRHLYERELQLAATTQELHQLNLHLENLVVTRTAALAAEVRDRKRAQEDLQLYAARLERSNGELQEFAYVSSHDLQEPLRKIQAFGDRLRDNYAASLDEQGRDYLSRMQNAAARMQYLIESLLAYSRVTTKARPFERTDLQRVAEEVLCDLETHMAEAQARVEVTGLPVLEADPVQMQQLLQNLIGNALKFHKAGVAPFIRISGERLSDDHAVNWCRIHVADNGIGFDEKYTERIFQVFHRLHGRGQYEGAGIGLSICRKIVERHGGSITANSTPGQGSTFTVTLPMTHLEGGLASGNGQETRADLDG